ncbi:MAG: phosphomethylpyrimidine synthase ThiC [Candidatus Cloacimonetes bacterium]|nr:phosphomethylpyrimidine synthase ThiC [Candidatus Cloacimonadota bacterium]
MVNNIIGYDFDLTNLHHTYEIKHGMISVEQATKLLVKNKGLSFINNGECSKLLGQTSDGSALIKVAINTGISHISQLESEKKKLDKLISLPYLPDIIFDHTHMGEDTINEWDKRLYAYIARNFSHKVVIATSPIMEVFDPIYGVDKNKLFDSIEHMALCGVRLMLFHPTTSHDNWKTACSIRKKPSTSWTGSLLYKDMLLNKRVHNIVAEHFDDILNILKKYGITLDIGSTFRPSRISEALDEAHVMELKAQEIWISKAKNAGVLCIREGLGHIQLNYIPKFAEIIDHSTPMMPLPVSTDASIGFDHVSSAIAMTVLGLHCNIGVLNPVTRVEHTGGIPTIDDIIEELQTARIVAHSLDICNIPKCNEIDNIISDLRQGGKTCVVRGGIFDKKNVLDCKTCIRCGAQCPLRLN